MAGRTDPLGGESGVAAARCPCSLFGLAPSGVCRAKPVARPAGELLPHRFTLTARAEARAAVCFLLHFPWPRGRWALPITASCGARTFLPPDPTRSGSSFQTRPAIIRPTSDEIKHRPPAAGREERRSFLPERTMCDDVAEGPDFQRWAHNGPSRQEGPTGRACVQTFPRLTPKSRTTKLQEESGRRAPGSRDGTSSARTTCVRNHDVR